MVCVSASADHWDRNKNVFVKMQDSPSDSRPLPTEGVISSTTVIEEIQVEI